MSPPPKKSLIVRHNPDLDRYKQFIRYLSKELQALRKERNKMTSPNKSNLYVELPQYSTKSTYALLSKFNGLEKVQLDMDNVINIAERVKAKQAAAAKQGTDSTVGDGEDWLSNLSDETVFVCGSRHPQDPNPLLHEYIVVNRQGGLVKLLSNLNEPEVYLWVDPQKFCQLYTLKAILHQND